MKMAIHKYWGLTWPNQQCFPDDKRITGISPMIHGSMTGITRSRSPNTPHLKSTCAVHRSSVLGTSSGTTWLNWSIFCHQTCFFSDVFLDLQSLWIHVRWSLITFLDQSPRRPHLDQRHGVFGHTAQWARRLGGWLRVGWYVLNSYYRFSLDPHTTGSSGYSGAIWNLTTSNAIILFEAWRLWGCNCSDCNLSATASSEYQSFLWSCQAQLLPTKCTITHFINMVQWITLALFESSSVCGKCCKLWQLRRQRREMFLEVEKHLHGALLYKI